MKSLIRLFFLTAIAAVSSPLLHAQGVMLRGVGAVNESVGGTATAMPIDAAGALLWNPASISALEKNEISIGLELIQPHTRVTTSGAQTLNGSTKGEAGITPTPSMAFTWRKCPKSPFTYGLGLAGVGGAAALYPHDPSNLILAANGKSATVIVLQVAPTASVQLTKRLSIGAAPLINLASLNINPMSLGADLAPADTSLMTYGTKYAWGGGFQIGTLYDFENHFKAGFTFKSPIWAEDLYFTGTDKTGQPANRRFDLNLPMTLSAGVSYDGFKNTIIGMDVRYFDYAHTAGFKQGLVGAHVAGLGWDSVWSISVGAERQLTKKLKGRMGYCWNENPIPGESAVLNVSAPLMTQHVLSFGGGYTLAKNLELSASYCYAFNAKVTGPTMTQYGGTVTSEVSADTFAAGVTKKW